MARPVIANENRHVDEYGIDIHSRYVHERIRDVVKDLTAEGMYKDTMFRALQAALFDLRTARGLDKCTDESALLCDLIGFWPLQSRTNNLVAKYEAALRRVRSKP